MSTDPERHYERYMDDFGRRLSRAASTHAARRDRSRRRFGAAAAMSAAAGAIAAALLVGLGSGGGIDVVAKARAALAPKGEIVHMVLSSYVNNRCRGASPCPRIGEATRLTKEQWSADDPYRVRDVYHFEIRRHAKKEGEHPHPATEIAYAHGKTREYLPSRNRMMILTNSPPPAVGGLPGGAPLSSLPRRWHALRRAPGDPAAVLRKMLSSDRLHDAGTAQVGGRTVRRLTGSGADGAIKIVYDVDPDTFAPVGGTVTRRLIVGDGSTITSVTSFKIKAYDRIALTPTTAKLLKINPKPGVKTTTHKLPLRLKASIRGHRIRCCGQRKR